MCLCVVKPGERGLLDRAPGHERRIVAFAWVEGRCNAKPADVGSARVLADGFDDPARPHLGLAEQVCVDARALSGTSKARVHERLTSRLERIRIRKANPPKPPPAFPRNGRARRISPLRALTASTLPPIACAGDAVPSQRRIAMQPSRHRQRAARRGRPPETRPTPPRQEDEAPQILKRGNADFQIEGLLERPNSANLPGV